MRTAKPYFDITVVDAMQCMVPVLSEARDDILLTSTVFGEYVGPGDGHLLADGTRALPSDEVLFYLARDTGAKEILCGCRSSGDIRDLHDADVGLARRLLAAGDRNGVHVLDLIVVRDGLFRFMSASTDLWAPGTGLLN
jgi:hypothetical protein